MIKRTLGMLLVLVCMSQGITVYAKEGITEIVLPEEEILQVAPGELVIDDSIESVGSVRASGNILLSDNEGKNDYYRYYSSGVITSNLTMRANGFFTRVEYASDGNVYIEEYSKNFELTDKRTISAELPLFGGFYDDGTNYYLVFGQENQGENDNVEVFRIVKYSKSWTRLSSASVYGANTEVPFNFGSLRMDADNGYLYIRTCHTMYTSNDGLNHQANVTIKIRVSDMSVMDSAYEVAYTGVGYVSHSFNQFIKVENGMVYAMDHGDFYPRSAVIFMYDDSEGNPWSWGPETAVDTMEYAHHEGEIYQFTGGTLGGFEVSDTSVLTAGSSSPQDGINKYMNIYVTATDKNNFSEAGTRINWITNNTDSSADIGNPQLVEIDKNNYLLLWTSCGDLKYLRLDGRGNSIGSIVSSDGELSDCQPIYDSVGKRVVWYVTDGKDLTFYSIDVNTWGLNEKEVEDKPPVPSWPFADVEERPDYWKYEAVKYVYENDIMKGVGDGSEFKPDDSLTRAMFATMLYRMAGEPAVTYTAKYTDVYPNRWYSKAIIWASEQGIVSGYGNGRFGTDDFITREQIAKMFMEYGRIQGYDVSQRQDFSTFADAGKVSGWANDYMKWAVGSGMITGSDKNGKYYLNPNGKATRAESATMLKRFMEKY